MSSDYPHGGPTEEQRNRELEAIYADLRAINEHPDRFFVESDGDLGLPKSVYIVDKTASDTVCTMTERSNHPKVWKQARTMCRALNNMNNYKDVK